MADRETTEMLKLIIDNMATKDDLKDLEARIKGDLRQEIRESESRLNTRIDRLDTRIDGLESKVDGMQDSIISKMITQDDLLMIANRAATMAGALYENTTGKQVAAIQDGHTQLHEKQSELEQRVDDHDRAIDDIRSQIA